MPETPIHALISALARRGITLQLSSDGIRYHGPSGATACEELNEARERRAEILSFLQSSGRRPGSVLGLGDYPRPTTLPLSCNQRWRWELEQVTGPTRQCLLTVPVNGAVDTRVMERVCAELVRRHEALRTRFVATPQGPVATVDSPDLFSLAHVDLSALPAAVRDTHAPDLIDEYRHETFELNGGRLLRACLVKIDVNLHVVLIGMHHIITDGWSNTILLREMRLLYNAYLTGKPAPLPEPVLQHSDFAVWEQKWLESAGGGDPYAYWDRRLENIAPLELPTDTPRTPGRLGSPEAKHSFEISNSTTQSLRGLSRNHGVTVQTSLLAVYSLLLARWSGRSDILIGCYMACRIPPGVEDLVGCFASNRPLPLEVSPRDTFREHLERVRLAHIETQDLLKPIGMRIAWKKRLNAVVANFIRTEVTEAPGLPAYSPRTRPYCVYHELMLSLRETSNGIHGLVSYAGDLFTAERIMSFGEDFQELARIAAGLPSLTTAEVLAGEWRKADPHGS